MWSCGQSLSFDLEPSRENTLFHPTMKNAWKCVFSFTRIVGKWTRPRPLYGSTTTIFFHSCLFIQIMTCTCENHIICTNFLLFFLFSSKGNTLLMILTMQNYEKLPSRRQHTIAFVASDV